MYTAKTRKTTIEDVKQIKEMLSNTKCEMPKHLAELKLKELEKEKSERLKTK